MKDSERAIWDRLVSAVEKGVANQFFSVQFALINESHESAISTGSNTSVKSDHYAAEPAAPVTPCINAGPPPVRSASPTAASVAADSAIVSFPPPVFQSLSNQPMRERDDEEEDDDSLGRQKQGSSGRSDSSGRGSWERQQVRSQSPSGLEAQREPRVNLVARQKSPLSFSHGAAPFFRPLSTHTRDAPGDSGDEMPSHMMLPNDTGLRHREIILTDRAVRMAQQACIVDNEHVLMFLLDSDVPAGIDLLELACLKGSVDCAKQIHERCNLPFSAEMLMHAVVSGFSELAMCIAPTDLSPGQVDDDDIKRMLVASVSSISTQLLAAVTETCRKEEKQLADLIQPIGDSLMSALLENVLRSQYASELETGARLLHFLVEHGVPLPAGFARPSDGPATQRSKRQHELLLTFLSSLVSFSDSVLTAQWGSLPLNFCSTDIFFRNSVPLLLIRVDLSNNNLSSLPSVLFDGSMATLRSLDASHNNLLDLDSLRSGSRDFSASRYGFVEARVGFIECVTLGPYPVIDVHTGMGYGLMGLVGAHKPGYKGVDSTF